MKEYKNPLDELETSHIIKMVREAADISPNRTARCRYVKGVHQLQPMCLVGHALYALGVPLEWLLDHNDAGINELYPSQYQFTDEEVRNLNWLGCAQGAQDSKRTWAEAVARADREWPMT